MDNPFQIFSSEQFGKVRATFANNQLWLVGADVANALGYVKTDGAIKRHVAKEDRRSALVRLHPAFQGKKAPKVQGARRYMTIINESGLYALTLSSRLPEAEKFRDWVTGEVLPAIRKTGSYSLFLKPAEVPAPKEDTIPAAVEEKACVYVLGLTNSSTKIGITKDILERARIIEKQSGATVERIYNSALMSKDVALAVEKTLHDKFDAQRLEGEFFSVPFEVACRALVLALSDLPADPKALPDPTLADKIFAYAEKISDASTRDKILTHAVNLLVGHERF